MKIKTSQIVGLISVFSIISISLVMVLYQMATGPTYRVANPSNQSPFTSQSLGRKKNHDSEKFTVSKQGAK